MKRVVESKVHYTTLVSIISHQPFIRSLLKVIDVILHFLYVIICFYGLSKLGVICKFAYNCLVPYSAFQVVHVHVHRDRPLTANLRWRPFSSVPHVSDRLELDNNNRASWILHPGPSESDVYSDVVQEARWNDLLHTAHLLIRLHVDTPLHGNNARGAKYAVYYASVATHPVFENIKMAALRAMSEEKSCSPFPCFFIPW